MNQATSGWILFIAAVGMMCSLLAVDVARLATLDDIWSTMFMSSVLAHLGTVIMAFIGGKLIPTDRNPTSRTRISDKLLDAINRRTDE